MQPKENAEHADGREENKVHDHHRKKIFWGTFLASKKNFPDRWWIQKPYENPMKTISTTEIFPLWPHFFCGKEKFCTGAGRCMLSFGSAKTDPVRFKWGFGEGRLKDKFAFFEAYKNPISQRRKMLAKRPFLQAKKGPV